MPTITFQQGTTYSGTLDVSIRQARAKAAPANASTLSVDGDAGGAVQTLLAFTGLFGAEQNQIPLGATIVSATVTLRTSDATLSGASLHRMLAGWNEASSWLSLVNGVQLDGVEAAVAADLAVGAVARGLRTFDVTASVQAWLAGAGTAEQANQANLGWVFATSGTDSWGFRSSESTAAPILTVTFSTPTDGPDDPGGPVTIGPSTLTAPYLVASQPYVRFTSIVTAGDALPGGGPFAGAPDGLGAFANGDGTITVLVNHELRATAGSVRDHGAEGAFVDRLVIDAATLRVVGSDDLVQTVQLWDAATGTYVAAITAFDRLCSSDLADGTAFYNSASGLGTDARIYLTGEEAGTEGRAFAMLVNGADAGTAYELALFGNLSYENVVASPLAQDKTVVAMTDDVQGGQVYLYVGDKQASGSDIDKAGLTNGLLYGVKVTGTLAEVNATPAGGSFTLQEIGPGGNASGMTGADIELESDNEGVTAFLRPEDLCWDPDNPHILYFTTTNTFSGNSRLYRLTFTDLGNPQAGGTIEAVLTGTEGHKMLDNLTIVGGKIILQEDPGNVEHLAKVWQYDIATDSLAQLAEFDPARFSPGGANFITQDDESSGVIDASAWLGDADTSAYLVNAMLDVPTATGVVKKGQLMVMYVDHPPAPDPVPAAIAPAFFNRDHFARFDIDRASYGDYF